MSEKLSYEEWKNKFVTVVPTKEYGWAREGLNRVVLTKEFMEESEARELENLLMKEYEFYVGGGYDPRDRFRGCRVCGIGANGEVIGYVCDRGDCPTRITCT